MYRNLCLLFYLLSMLPAPAQPSFQQIKVGSPVNSPADSRSVNFVDINQDSWDDLFISNGPKGGQNNQLFLNNGDGTFREITGDPITSDHSPSDGATFADMDGDGDLDVFVVTWYGNQNLLYENRGDGSFCLLEKASPTQAMTFSETAAWGDFNNDHWLDLYVTNSTDFKTNAPAIQQNLFYHNDRTGNLLPDNSWPQTANISRCVNWIDYDRDGDTDLFITNEENQPNQLYQNNGSGSMTAISSVLSADTLSSISSSWADVDNDGDFDLFIANWLRQTNQLFYNEGNGTFRRHNMTPDGEDGGCSFGSAFGDADNDGDLDLFVTNAFCRGQLKNFFYLNDGRGNFTPDTTSFPDLNTVSSYGVAWGDIDNDGHLDLMVANCTPHPSIPQPTNTLFHNLGNDHHWLKIRVVASNGNTSAIGAQIQVKAAINGRETWQLREISSQSGYCGQNSLTAHFGLADATRVDSLIVTWPGGKRTVMEQLPTDTIHVIVED